MNDFYRWMPAFMARIERLGPEAKKTLIAAARAYVADVKRTAPVRTGRLRASFRTEETERGVRIMGAPYAWSVDQGKLQVAKKPLGMLISFLRNQRGEQLARAGNAVTIRLTRGRLRAIVVGRKSRTILGVRLATVQPRPRPFLRSALDRWKSRTMRGTAKEMALILSGRR